MNENQINAMKLLYAQPVGSFIEMAARFQETGDLRLLKLTGFVKQRVSNHGVTYSLTQKGRDYVEKYKHV